VVGDDVAIGATTESLYLMLHGSKSCKVKYKQKIVCILSYMILSHVISNMSLVHP
jgi:hypothetical protein